MNSSLWISSAAAASSPPGDSAPGKKPSVIEQFMPFVFILLIIYFLLIRPSQKRMKAHAEFTQKLKKGDEVLTTGGVLGVVKGLTEKYASIEVSSGVDIRVLRSHISSFAEKPGSTGPKA